MSGYYFMYVGTACEKNCLQAYWDVPDKAPNDVCHFDDTVVCCKAKLNGCIQIAEDDMAEALGAGE